MIIASIQNCVPINFFQVGFLMLILTDTCGPCLWRFRNRTTTGLLNIYLPPFVAYNSKNYCKRIHLPLPQKVSITYWTKVNIDPPNAINGFIITYALCLLFYRNEEKISSIGIQSYHALPIVWMCYRFFHRRKEWLSELPIFREYSVHVPVLIRSLARLKMPPTKTTSPLSKP